MYSFQNWYFMKWFCKMKYLYAITHCYPHLLYWYHMQYNTAIYLQRKTFGFIPFSILSDSHLQKVYVFQDNQFNALHAHSHPMIFHHWTVKHYSFYCIMLNGNVISLLSITLTALSERTCNLFCLLSFVSFRQLHLFRESWFKCNLIKH